jgi:hypothetical protein
MKRSMLWSVLLVLISCSNTTGGALIHLPFSVGGVERPAAGRISFTTPLGWTVTLDEAVICLGPYYFNVSPPSSAAIRSGVVIVQVTQQVAVNPLDPTLLQASAGADGETGTAVGVEMGLLPPDPSQSAEIQDLLDPSQSVAHVRGTATKGGTTVPFAGFVTIDLSQASPQRPPEALQRVIGSFAPALTFTTEPQQLALRVDPTPWFDTTEFSDLLSSPPGEDGNYTWNNTTNFHTQLLQGLQTLTGYVFTLSPR